MDGSIGNPGLSSSELAQVLPSVPAIARGHTLPRSMPEQRLPAHKSQKRLQRRARGRAVRDSWRRWHLPMLSLSS